jgi:hypothetical protein
MSSVPAFVRDAGWPAFAAAVAAVIATLRLAQRTRRRAAQRRVREALAPAPVPPAEWRDGAEVAVRGVLRADRAITTVAVVGFANGDELTELTHDAIDDAWLEVADVRVALGEPLTVRVGSHVVRHHEPPRERFEAAMIGRDKARRATELRIWRGGVDGYHLRKVAAGDEVLARGRLARDGDGWRLVPAGGVGSAIELAAIRAVVDPVMLPPQTSVGRAMVFAAVAFLATAYLTSL